MKKIININLAILIAFVLASGVFTVSGSVYAQGNEDEDQGDNENSWKYYNHGTFRNPQFHGFWKFRNDYCVPQQLRKRRK